MNLKFPITVNFHEDHESWVFNTLHEIECNLEWFDSEDPEQNAEVLDADGHQLKLKVERLQITCIERA